MKLGIVGLPGAGKTTIFNALTRGDAPTGQSMGGRFDVLTAVVDVRDERVETLTQMFNPQKKTEARITYTDVAGLKKGAGANGGISGALLNHLAAMDGLVHVVRAFESDTDAAPRRLGGRAARSGSAGYGVLAQRSGRRREEDREAGATD